MLLDKNPGAQPFLYGFIDDHRCNRRVDGRGSDRVEHDSLGSWQCMVSGQQFTQAEDLAFLRILDVGELAYLHCVRWRIGHQHCVVEKPFR